MQRSALRVKAAGSTLSAALVRPEDAVALLVLAHGAGADFRHANMLAIAEAFAKQKIATLRFNFPFMENGRRRVGSQAEAVAAIVAALAVAKVAAPDLALFSGGHSYGGRMASHAALADDLGVCGLVFCSVPLHPPKKPGLDRAAHLAALDLPMLFLSGTRDALAESDLLEACLAIQQRRDLTLVHPFDDPMIIAGQGTVGLEILDDMPDDQELWRHQRPPGRPRCG